MTGDDWQLNDIDIHNNQKIHINTICKHRKL